MQTWLPHVHIVTKPGASDPARLHSLCAKIVVPLAGVVLAALAPTLLPQEGSPITVWLVVIGILSLTAIAAVALLVFAEVRRACDDNRIWSTRFWFDPKPVRVAMRSIFESAETICASQAYRDGLLDGAALHEAVYSAALSAIDAKHIRGGMPHLNVHSEEHLKTDGQAALSVIDRNLASIASELRTAADTAMQLSNKLPSQPLSPAAPTRQWGPSAGEIAAAREAEKRRAADIDAMQKATARAAARGSDTGTHVSDAVSGVSEGYDEVTRITRRVINGPHLDEIARRDRPGDAPRAKKAADTNPDQAGQTPKDKTAKRFHAAAQRSRSAYRQIQTARETVQDSLASAKGAAVRSRSNIARLTGSAKRRNSNSGPPKKGPESTN